MWEQHRSSIWKACLYFTQDYHDAEDLMQATWIKAHQYWQRHQPEKVTKAFLAMTAKHIWIDLQRKKSIDVTPLDQIELDQLSTEDPNHSSELSYILNVLIKHLTTKQLVLFLLADVCHCSLKEIADLTQLSIGAIKASLFRARQNIKQRVRHRITEDIVVDDDESMMRVQLFSLALRIGDVQLLASLLTDTISVPSLYVQYQQKDTSDSDIMLVA